MKLISDVARDALELPNKQRLTLARILIELSDDTAFSPEVDAAWNEEICRRMNAVEEGSVSGRDFDE